MAFTWTTQIFVAREKVLKLEPCETVSSSFAAMRLVTTTHLHQEYLGIYYYAETRSYNMFGARSTTYPVLGCRSAGKITSQSQTTKQIAPPRRPQDSKTMITIRVFVGVWDRNFSWRWHFQIFASHFPKINWLVARDSPSREEAKCLQINADNRA